MQLCLLGSSAPSLPAACLYLVDWFDAQEVSSSGFHAARLYWPEAFQGLDAAGERRVEEGMAAVRPVLVKGFEAMIMVRQTWLLGERV